MSERKTIHRVFWEWDFEKIEHGSRKKEYQLTDEGLLILKHELARLQQLVANGESILQEKL